MAKRLLTDSFPGPINETRAASTAAGGTALSTTVAIIPVPNGTTHVTLTSRNYSTAVVAKYAVNPYLLILRTDNNLSTVTDSSVQGQQVGGTGISFNALPTLANSGAFYIGSHVPFRGLSVDVQTVNAVASVLTMSYWNGTGWTSLSATDNTTSGGATLAQDGTITWTIPTSPVWALARLTDTKFPVTTVVSNASLATLLPYNDKPRYWTQFKVSAALTTTVLINTIYALNRSTAYAELAATSSVSYRMQKGPDGLACVEALTDAGTGNLIVNCSTDNAAGIF